jgi:AmiR/NasT family two-component response regulator
MSLQARSPASEVAPVPPATALRVLVCEDQGLTSLRLRKTLSALGYEVVGTARDGEEAVREARRLHPDVILMDVNMPRLDGIEATQGVMREFPTAIVMLTAYSEPELVQRALAAGASGYLVKPVSDDQLRPAIAMARERFLELRQERETASSLAANYHCPVPVVPGFQLAARYLPASEVARVGGDFFDFVELTSDRFGVVIGDVCGSGIAAAGYTTMARHMLRAYSLEDPAPARVLTRLNRALCDQMPEECPFITVVYGVLDVQARCFTYANAGHPAPILGRSDVHTCRELDIVTAAIGVVPGLEYSEESVSVPPGAVLALVTDGITEARHGRSADGESRMLGGSGVCAVVRESLSASAEGIVNAILSRARQFAGGTVRDDVAIVVLKNGPIGI